MGKRSVSASKVCFQWWAGYCNRHPCPYLHTYLAVEDELTNNNTRGFLPYKHSKVLGTGNVVSTQTVEVLCKYWLEGICDLKENCRFLHVWHKSDAFSQLSLLNGHEQAVTGIALPSGSDKLYSGSKDGTLRVWDCNTGQGIGVFNCGCEISCLANEGPWIIVGLGNIIRAWNVETNAEIILDGGVVGGKVLAIVTNDNMVFAGVEDGSILIWKYDSAKHCFEPAAVLKGHTGNVMTLKIGCSGRRLYSGSMDRTIRIWNVENFECIQTLKGHSDAVMSVLGFQNYLLSCSLDNTIKVWAYRNGVVVEEHTHQEKSACLNLRLIR